MTNGFDNRNNWILYTNKITELQKGGFPDQIGGPHRKSLDGKYEQTDYIW